MTKKTTKPKSSKPKPKSKKELKLEAAIVLQKENEKKILKHIPTQEDIEGKSLEELSVIFKSILTSEAALNRKDPDFLEKYNAHCESLRRISRMRRKIQGIPEPK